MPKKRSRDAALALLRHRYHSPNIPMAAIRRYAPLIAERFQPDKIILFGSYAYGTPHGDSDVDLLVVMPAYNEITQSIRICLALPAPFSLDLIVRKPEQLHWDPDDVDWFLREILEKGKILYELKERLMGTQGRRRLRNGKKARPRKDTLP